MEPQKPDSIQPPRAGLPTDTDLLAQSRPPGVLDAPGLTLGADKQQSGYSPEGRGRRLLRCGAIVGSLVLPLANAGSIPELFEGLAVATPAAAERHLGPDEAKVPKVGGDALNLALLRNQVRRAGFKFAGVRRIGGYPNLTPDKEGYTVDRWQNWKIVVNRPGRKNDRYGYRNVRPGSIQQKGSKLRAVPEAVERSAGPPIDVPSGERTPVSEPPTENPNPKPEINLGFETTKFLAERTAYVNFSRCSGLFHVDASGVTKAVSFADHCFRYTTTGRDSSGQRYAKLADNRISSGDVLGGIRTRMTFSSVIVPTENTTSTDFALAIRDGSTVSEVLALKRESSMTAEEINLLVSGKDKFSLSGWPNSQPYNMSGELRRQTWEMTYLANNVPIHTTAEKDLRVVMAGVHETPDGALPTDGASGAEVISVKKVTDSNGDQRTEIKTAGPNVGNYDLRKGSRNVYGYSDQLIDDLIKWIKDTTGVDVSGYDGVVFFAPDIPTEASGNIAKNFEVMKILPIS